MNFEKPHRIQLPILFSVPFQNNTAFDIDPFSRTQNVLEIEPVIPVHLTKSGCSSTALFSPLCGSRIQANRLAVNTVLET